MTEQLMQREDFQGMVDYVVDVCREAIADNAQITPLILLARMDGHTPMDVRLLPLEQPEHLMHPGELMAQLLEKYPDLHLACYTAGALMQSGEVTEDISPEAVLAQMEAQETAGEEAVITLVISRECQAMAFHQVDRAQRRVLPGELHFPNGADVRFVGDINLPTPQRH